MADGPYGERTIFIDLNSPITARVIKDATKGEWVKFSAIHIAGTGPATAANGPIILRKESASGPIVFQFIPTAASQTVTEDKEWSEKVPIHKGLYMDAMTTGWVAGSCMTIDTA